MIKYRGGVLLPGARNLTSRNPILPAFLYNQKSNFFAECAHIVPASVSVYTEYVKKKRNLSLGGFVDWINSLPAIFKYPVSLIVIADFWMIPKVFIDMRSYIGVTDVDILFLFLTIIIILFYIISDKCKN